MAGRHGKHYITSEPSFRECKTYLFVVGWERELRSLPIDRKANQKGKIISVIYGAKKKADRQVEACFGGKNRYETNGRWSGPIKSNKIE